MPAPSFPVTLRLRLVLGLTVATALLLGAALLPTAWYDALPRNPALVPPIRGTTLLRLVLAALGLGIGTAVMRGWTWQPLPASLLAPRFAPWSEPGDIEATTARRTLALITLLALGLRLMGLDSDLWLDELLTLRGFAPLPVGEIITSYRSPNNHLLNTLFIKGSVALFGEHAWSVRLITALLGTASVPTLYRVARLAMSRRASLGAALLLAVSYHHIFFSQNARGFTPYLFFALIACRALADGLREQRQGPWVVFGLANGLGLMSLLNAAFVIVVEVMVATVVVFRIRATGVPVGPLLRRLAVVFGVTGLCAFGVYAVALPDAYMIIANAYTALSFTGSKAGSGDLTAVVVRGVTDGFGTGVLLAAIPFLAVAGSGLVILWRRQWIVAALLFLPGVVTAVVLASRGMTFSPRHFLLWLPCAIVTAAVTIDALAGRLAATAPRRRATLTTGLVALLAITSVAALPRYYAVPKQPYSAAVRHLARTRADNEWIFLVRPAVTGISYYAHRDQPHLVPYLVEIRAAVSLDSALALRGTRHVRLVTTLEQYARKADSTLIANVRARFRRDTTFAATMGDGEISIWSERPATAGARRRPTPGGPAARRDTP